jgi:hypothetical protein
VVVEAVGDDRLRVRFANGHSLEVRAPDGAPNYPGDRGQAALASSPTGGWRFIAEP